MSLSANGIHRLSRATLANDGRLYIAGCMAALQAEHFLQLHASAEGEAAKVPAEKAPAKALENGAVHQNGAAVMNGEKPQLVAAL